jgi:ATP-dependent helicase Lhr and Lhr-like helicase
MVRLVAAPGLPDSGRGAYDRGMQSNLFHPLIESWFVERFGTATEPQQRGWPEIAARRNTLIAAPTGSGKTLAAFLVCLDRLFRRWLEGTLEDRTYIVYVSPLKALGNDIHRNLEVPLAEIGQRAVEAGLGDLPIRAAVRTGDTPAAERQAMLRRPPHILVTTPESLYLLLTSQRSRALLNKVDTIIVDEIHALVRDKRGSHLALSLERLEALCEQRPVRIGLSATQRPMETIAQFLVGTEEAGDQRPEAIGNGEHELSLPRAFGLQPSACSIIDAGHARELDLAIEVPPSELSAVCSNEQWAEIYTRLTELIAAHRSTLIFVNTRRLAERVALHLTEILGDDAVASHHGSLSKEIRQSAERRLKAGELRAIVATASLEMGIDIGYIDLVCQIGSPRSIATFLQRVGRAGHSLGKVPKGRLLPLSRDELMESLTLIRAVRRGRLDAVEIPQQPLDILAQQIVAAVGCEDWDETALFELFRKAWPYRALKREDFDAIVEMLSEGIVPGTRRGAYLHRDVIHNRLRARRGARLAALTSGGAIPETAQYRVVAEPEGTFVGTVDEDFAVESIAGDVFVLGNTSWRVQYVRGGEVLVRDAEGAPPSIPFWLGEAPGRTPEFSTELSELRQEIATRVKEPNGVESAIASLGDECGAPAWPAEQAVRYVEAQLAAVGMVPTCDEILFERFFDESGGMQLVIHAPLGSRINRAWGLALRKRFCRSFDFELQASADNDGIVLSMGPQHSVPIENLFRMLNSDNVAKLLEQALLAVPMFQVRWRWNLTRSLVVLRQQGGKRVQPYLQRFRSDDLMAAVFPETVGCLENHSGDIQVPDHPLVRQTMHDCLHEAMDLDGLIGLFERVRSGQVRFVGRDTREPSPFSYELVNANPYAFLDGAPLEERRVRAVATRRTLSPQDMGDLAKLDPDAVAQVAREAWPVVRDAEELHDALLNVVAIDEMEAEGWLAWLQELAAGGRATRVVRCGQRNLWTAAETWPVIQAIFPDAHAEPPIVLPERLQREVPRHEALVALVRGRIEHSGPTTAARLGDFFGVDSSTIEASLEALEGQGVVLRGRFVDHPSPLMGDGPGEGDGTTNGSSTRETSPLTRLAAQASLSHEGRGQDSRVASTPKQWCDRRLLARIHRLTIRGLRDQIRPVEPHEFLRFLVRHHHMLLENQWGGAVGVREAIAQLQGFELPAGAWESRVLSARVSEYDPQWLDNLFLAGEVVWGRISPPHRAEDSPPSMAPLTRVVPISLILREDLSALLPHEEGSKPMVRGAAQAVLDALEARGALFFNELTALTGMLPAYVEESLRELAALGLVTSDVFGAIRKIVEGNRARGSRRRRTSRRPLHATTAPIGRWSLFPGMVGRASRAQHLEAWCRQLLLRWGVVFRDLLERESSAPSWQDLVSTFRRLELRGEVRGGRFVSGVAGEQYAAHEAVDRLRQARDTAADDIWLVLSAADPLNLFGTVVPGPRIAATHRNALVLRDGRLIASRQAGEAEFYEPVDRLVEWSMRRAMATGRRPQPDAKSPETVHPTQQRLSWD